MAKISNSRHSIQLARNHILTAAALAMLLATPILRSQEPAQPHEHEEAPSSEPVAKPRIIFSSNPKIVAYQLSRLSDAELLLVDRNPDDVKFKPVYEAIAGRANIPGPARQEAIDALSLMSETSAALVVLDLIDQAAAQSDGEPGIAALATLLPDLTPGELQPAHGRFLQMLESENDAVKEAAYLGLLLTSSPEKVWDQAEENGEIAIMLKALPQVEGRRLSSLYDKLLQLAESSDMSEARLAAIESLPLLPGHATRSFKTLSDLALRGNASAAAVKGLLRLPTEQWPEDGLVPLVYTLIAQAKKMAGPERESDAFKAVVEFAQVLAEKMPPGHSRRIRAYLSDLAARSFLIKAVKHEMRYDLPEITVEAGKPVEIVFENPDNMPHNLVIVVPGSREKVGSMAEVMATESDAAAKGYIPDTPEVLYATRLLQAGEETILRFKAPEEPGLYEYVCTFPGHWRTMFGIMRVQ